MKNNSIAQWPVDDRPREKLLKHGEKALSNAELLAILLHTGIKGQSAVDLARSILERFGSFRAMSHADARSWREFKGLGQAKTAQIKAAIEIGRRLREEEIKEDRPQIKNAKDAADLLMPRMRDLKVEVFKVICLNAQNRVIEVLDITEGTVNGANPIIREIMHKALQHYAVSIICAHNHPSGETIPSQDDIKFTQELLQTVRILGLQLVDHIIVGNNKYYSFTQKQEF
ncbi:MAG: DNA repair protein RadC [Candidatus Omnitrophica bacterium]|nr:DNA repair protein RadC [Candidatus Omnitrophota bacterium]